MRHLNSGSKLGKQPAHRRGCFAASSPSDRTRRITTTLTRAKAARPVAEKMITLGKRDTLQSRVRRFLHHDALLRRTNCSARSREIFRRPRLHRIIHPAIASATTPRWPSSSSSARIQSQGKKEKTKKEETRRSQKLVSPRRSVQAFSGRPSLSMGRAFFFLQIFVIRLFTKGSQAAGALLSAISFRHGVAGETIAIAVQKQRRPRGIKKRIVCGSPRLSTNAW